MKLKQLLCAALAALMILPLAACGDTGEGTGSTEASATGNAAASDTESDSETKETLDLEDKTFDGFELVFVTRDESEWSTVEIVPEENSEFVNIAEAVTERNEIIKTKYGVTLGEIKTDNGSYASKVNNEIIAPTGDFQAIVSSMANAAGFVRNGALVDLAGETCSSYIDLNKSWWDRKMSESLAIEGKVYFATGDILTSDNDATFMMMFNKKIATETKLGDLYQMVNNGTWTMDTMYSMAQLAVNDKDGDGKLAYDSDVAGFAYTVDAPYCLMYAGGLQIIKRDSDDSLTYELDIKRADNIAAKTRLLFDKSLTVDINNTGATSVVVSGQKCFGEEHALFMGECMQCVSRMRNYDVDFGILPFPKYDESQTNYFSIMHLTGGVVSIPKSMQGESLERVAYLLEAISYYSVDTLTHLYYDLNLKTKNAKDAESGPMIDLILANRVYDVAYTYRLNNVVDNIAAAMLPSGKKNVASMERASKSGIERGLKNLLRDIQKSEK